MQDISLRKHRFSFKYILRRRKICGTEYEAAYLPILLRRMPKAAFIIILLSLLSLAACAAVQIIRGFTEREYKGYVIFETRNRCYY